jgi:hypothetical protein
MRVFGNPRRLKADEYLGFLCMSLSYDTDYPLVCICKLLEKSESNRRYVNSRKKKTRILWVYS